MRTTPGDDVFIGAAAALEASHKAQLALLDAMRLASGHEQVSLQEESDANAGVPQQQRLLLRVREAAELMGVSRSKAYELVASGEWPSFRLGSSRRVVCSGLVGWVDEHREEG